MFSSRIDSYEADSARFNIGTLPTGKFASLFAIPGTSSTNDNHNNNNNNNTGDEDDDVLSDEKGDNNNKSTLFSALISKRLKHRTFVTGRDEHSASAGIIDVDVRLDIPDLPDDVALLKWQIPTTATYEWPSLATHLRARHQTLSRQKPQSSLVAVDCLDDEGFVSEKDTSSHSNSFQQKQTQQRAAALQIAWENAWQLTVSPYVNWDTRKE